MKHLCLLFIFISIFVTSLFAQNDVSVQFMPEQIQVNVLSTSSFDPVNPYSQPVIATLQVKNNSSDSIKVDLLVKLFWGNTEIASAQLQTKSSYLAGQSRIYTNRDLLISSENEVFTSTANNMSLDEILRIDVLKNALFAGYFPDGVLRIQVQARPATTTPWQTTANFSITIVNTSAIYLVYPGKPIGQTPPLVNVKPVTLLWNSMATGFNQYRLLIKEFPPNQAPTASNINSSGAEFYNQVQDGSIFSSYLPFKDAYYYAWRVSTTIVNESGSNPLHSTWLVFKFVSDTDPETSLEMTAILNMLNNPLIQNLFSGGFSPTGNIIYEGRVYSGEEAMQLLQTLIGKELQIEITH